MADAPEVITTEVEASEATVNAVRNELPIGVGGAAIQRVPYNAALEMLANSGTYSKLIASEERCIRVVEVPVKGGSVKAHCSRPCISVGTQRLCPEHDRAAFAPPPDPYARKPRVTNSASIPLSKGEAEEVARASQLFAAQGDIVVPLPAASAPVPVAPTVPVARAELALGLNISIKLDDLASGDIRRVLAEAVCAALDELPAGNMRQMKQVVALQEQVNRVLKAKGRKRHGKRNPAAETL